MEMHFPCACGRVLTVDTQKAGATVECPQCGASLAVPADDPSPAAPADVDSLRLEPTPNAPASTAPAPAISESFLPVDITTNEFRGSHRHRTGSPLWIGTPALSGLACLLFFLPWVTVSCSMNAPSGGTMEMSVSQSGLQIARGSTTSQLVAIDGSGTRRIVDQSILTREMGIPGMNGAGGKNVAEGEEQDEPDAAPLLWAYLVALAFAVIAGLAFRSGKLPHVAVLASGLALGLLLVQVAMGFPMANRIAKQEAEYKQQEQQLGEFGGQLDLGGMGVKLPSVSYTPWFYLALVCTVAAPIPLIVDIGMRGRRNAE